MRRSEIRLAAALLAGALSSACTSGLDPEGELAYGKVNVTGTMVDFETGASMPTASVSVAGLTPAPQVLHRDGEFTIIDVPAHGLIQVLGGVPPEHRPTYGVSLAVEEDDVDGVVVRVLSEAFIAGLGASFGVEVAGTSLVLARAIDETGAPRAGIPAEAFILPAAAAGPFFLDEDRAPAPALEATSASGWVVYVGIEPGVFALAAATDSGYAMEMPSAASVAGTVTLAEVVVRDGDEEVPLPTAVSFEDDVVPIFARRGCDGCHTGGGAGKKAAGFSLDGSSTQIYAELMDEAATNLGARVDLADPAASLVLTMPSAESPADQHPLTIFTGPSDPDYQLLLAWITEGAL